MKIKIESNSNPIYKHIKKLQSRNGRSKFNQYIAEGKRAVADALVNGADVEFIVLKDGVSADFDTGSLKIYELDEKLFDTLSLTVNSQGIIAVINYELSDVSSADIKSFKTVVYLDSVTDPGNMGTIIRSCDALGADAIVISKGCVDIFNPKVVRSSMACMMTLPILTDNCPKETFSRFSENGFNIVGTFPDGDTYCCDMEYGDRVLLVMGNEANGICLEIENLCQNKVTIPMFGRAESLNVATALTVMLYEIKRSSDKNNKLS